MSDRPFAIVADDLTGASDTGAVFARQGLRTIVCVAPSLGGDVPPADVLVMSTESRQLPTERAAEAVNACAREVERWLAGRAPRWIYKKIDSTLRGHPAAELVALMRAMRIDRVLVAPAFPAQGRTTVGGRQRVNGVPLEETPFGSDVASSDVSALFSPWSARYPTRLIELADVRRGAQHVADIMAAAVGVGVWIGDAETEADLRVLARAAVLSRIPLLCGSAGLARAVALEDGRHVEPGQIPTPFPAAPVLVVAGSRSRATARQVDAAERAGIAIVRPAPAFAGDQSTEVLADVVEETARVLSSGRSVILTTIDLPVSPLGAAFVAQRLASVVVSLLDNVPIGGLVLTGGDTASAVCRALETGMLWLIGEVQPGMAIGSLIAGARPGLRVVTKAGDFGGDEALTVAVDCLMAR